jgi:hypothetical protein
MYHSYWLFTKHLRDSGLPADVLVNKFKKDISFALRRSTIAQVITHQTPCPRRLRLRWLRLATPAQCAVEDEERLALTDEQACWDR